VIQIAQTRRWTLSLLPLERLEQVISDNLFNTLFINTNVEAM
jgi:hypothetical protein